MMDGMGQGLAGQMSQQQQPNITVEQVIELLVGGATPEQLLEQGIPMEMIKQAVEYLMAQQGQGTQPAQPQGPPNGLAESLMR